MLERVIERKIIEYAKKKNIVSYKLVSPNLRGLPDRLLITSEGIIFFIEFKQKNKKPTKLQQFQIDLLRARNCKIYIIDDILQGYKIIDEYSPTTS